MQNKGMRIWAFVLLSLLLLFPYKEVIATAEEDILPSRYDGRDYGICPSVKEQGDAGNCWAVAATTALEAGMLPDEKIHYSAEHMSREHGFSRKEEGGDYYMIMAYLAGWKGPVIDSEGAGTEEASHVQEIQMLADGSVEEIKRAVLEYGAVQTSIYMDLKNAFSSSVYYNQIDYSYYYNGEEKPNHDVCIIGWDDDFPAESFHVNTDRNGAFLCQNSWGEKFGDRGVFYVSYEDVRIRENSMVYTRIEPKDNYDKLYQTDLCGWVGKAGYGDSSAYCANTFRAVPQEIAKAVGFYAVGKDTEYEIYVLKEGRGLERVRLMKPCAEGKLAYAGFYTIPLGEGYPIPEDGELTVIIRLQTPQEEYPIATEYPGDDNTREVTLTDGDGFISHNGVIWQKAEDEFGFNVCMKLYTTERQE